MHAIRADICRRRGFGFSSAPTKKSCSGGIHHTVYYEMLVLVFQRVADIDGVISPVELAVIRPPSSSYIT